MEVKLIVSGGSHAGQEVPIGRREFLIGRALDCHLRPQSDLVSRHHAAILVREGSVAVHDFDSKNGTFVNGERVNGEHELKTGDRLKIGPLEFEVQLAVKLGGKKKPKVHTVQEAAARTVEAAGDDDLDISEWLDDDRREAPPTDAGTTDTHTMTSAATVGPGVADAAGAADEETAEEPDKDKEEEEEKKKKKPVRVVGRFQDAAKPQTESSQSAADQMLKRFFGGRP